MTKTTTSENKKKKQVFSIDPALKETFNAFCRELGLVQEQILEALVYLIAVEGEIDSKKRDELMKKVSAWKKAQAKRRQTS